MHRPVLLLCEFASQQEADRFVRLYEKHRKLKQAAAGSRSEHMARGLTQGAQPLGSARSAKEAAGSAATAGLGETVGRSDQPKRKSVDPT